MSIKKYTYHLIGLCFILSNLLIAQEDKIGSLNIGLIMPQAGDIPNLSIGHISKIETKLLILLTNNGISSQGEENRIVMYPKVDIYDDLNINTNMQNLKIVRLTLSLFIKQTDSNTIFNSVVQELSGTGSTTDQAINNALMNISSQDPKWTSFLIQTKSKIMQYYESRCLKVIAQAEHFSQTGRIEKGIMILFNIPKETSCFNAATAKCIELYKKYNSTNCSHKLQLAKAKAGQNDYKTALSIASKIDPESSCFSEVTAFISSIEKKVDIKTLREWEFLKQAYQDSIELEKIRLNAIRDIGVAHGQGQSINYLYLIR